MIDAYKNILGEQNISIKDCFFDLGGDSIKAIRVLSFLRNQNYDVELKYLLSDYTIEEISNYYLNKKKSDYIENDQKEIIGEVKLSPIQKQFFSVESSKT